MIDIVATSSPATPATLQFLSVMGILALAFGFTSWYMLRKGGIYNPNMTVRDFTDLPPLPTPTAPSPSKRIYQTAYLLMGEHLTLNDNVPKELGCVQAVSFILRSAGFPVPEKGIDGVNALIDWLLKHGFIEVKKGEKVPGVIITAHRPLRADPAHAHAGICGENWIMSNTSADGPGGLKRGLFQANYTFTNWEQYFTQNGCVTRYFAPVEN